VRPLDVALAAVVAALLASVVVGSSGYAVWVGLTKTLAPDASRFSRAVFWAGRALVCAGLLVAGGVFVGLGALAVLGMAR